MRRIFCLAIVLLFTALVPCISASNGEYEAFISMDSGNYKAIVEVEDGEVIYVRRKDGEQLRLEGAKIVDGHAEGATLDGKQVYVEIEKYNDFSGTVGRTATSPGTVLTESAGTYGGGVTSDVP